MSNGEAREMGGGGSHAELANVRCVRRRMRGGGGRTTNMRGESHDTDEQVGVREVGAGGREKEKKCWRASHC